MIIEVQSEAEMKRLGESLGRFVTGGEVFELVGDVGAGKTTFVKGLAKGMGSTDEVQSPSFTISRVYQARRGMQLVHYDFYRLHDAGILKDELKEHVADATTVTVIEWADIVGGVLPKNRLTLHFTSPSETVRVIDVPDALRGAL